MARADTQVSETREQESAWIREIALVPSSYGRLVYLSGLLDPNTGRYKPYGLKPEKLEEASQAVKKCHESLFREWVAYPLARKMVEVQAYINCLGHIDRVQMIDAWLRLAPYKNLVPPAIQGPERQRHTSDFEAILGLLRNVYGVASPDQDA